MAVKGTGIVSAVLWIVTGIVAVSLPGCGQGELKLDEGAQHFVAAKQALDAGDQATALKELDASIAAEPDVWAYLERAKLYALQDRVDDAKADVEAGLSLSPENADLLWLQKELNKPANRRFRGSAATPPMNSK